jgi:signal transduction histidine kinase
LALQRLWAAMAVLAAFLAGALPIELYYYPGRLAPYLAVYGVEVALSLVAYAAAKRWATHARAIATAWAALMALCVCAYYPLVGGDATLAMAALICLISVVPATLPFGLWHQLAFGCTGALGFFAIVAWGVPMSLPWPYIFVAFLAVMTFTGMGTHALTRFRLEAFEREAVLQEAHDQLRTALARAESAVAMRDRLVANVSHELRTPLNVIVGYSAMLLEEGGDPAVVRDAAPRIRDYAISLEALVSQLLDLSRLACGKVDLTFEDIDLPTLLADAARATRVLLADKPVEVVVDCRAARCRSDRMRLGQILNNLATNAAKFTHRGRVTLLAREHGDWITLEVRDTGCGIPASKHEAIFTAFEQVMPRPTAGGIGLGLAIVRQLTDVLGGTVSVASTPGAGSLFTVVLPKTEAPAQRQTGATTSVGAAARARPDGAPAATPLNPPESSGPVLA